MKKSKLERFAMWQYGGVGVPEMFLYLALFHFLFWSLLVFWPVTNKGIYIVTIGGIICLVAMVFFHKVAQKQKEKHQDDRPQKQ